MKYLELNVKKATYQKLWEIPCEVLKGKFVVLNAYFKKEEKVKCNRLSIHNKKKKKQNERLGQE